MSDTDTDANTAAVAPTATEAQTAAVDESSAKTLKRFGWAILIAISVAASEQLKAIAPELAKFLVSLLPAWLIWAAPYITTVLLAIAAWLGKLGRDSHVESVDKAKELTPPADSPKRFY
jgi:hypothetical protein